jgi:hypothetical protein
VKETAMPVTNEEQSAAVAASIEPDDPPVGLRDAVVDGQIDDHLAAGGARGDLVAAIGNRLLAGDAAELAATTDPNRIVGLLAAAGVSAPYSARVLARMGCDLETTASALRGEASPRSGSELYLADDRHLALQVIGANRSEAAALAGLTNGLPVEHGGGAATRAAERGPGMRVMPPGDDTDVGHWADTATAMADSLGPLAAVRAVLAVATSGAARATALTVLAADAGDLAALIGCLGDEVDGGTVAAATEMVGWSPAAAVTAPVGANADPDVVAAAISLRCGNDPEIVNRVLADAWASHPRHVLSPPSEAARRDLHVVDGPAPAAVSAPDVGAGGGERRPTSLSRGLALIDRWWGQTSPSATPPAPLPGEEMPSIVSTVPGR